MVGMNDMREVERRAGEGDAECRLALDVYTAPSSPLHRRGMRRAWAAFEVIAFIGGVGENKRVRSAALLAAARVSSARCWMRIEIGMR